MNLSSDGFPFSRVRRGKKGIEHKVYPTSSLPVVTSCMSDRRGSGVTSCERINFQYNLSRLTRRLVCVFLVFPIQAPRILNVVFVWRKLEHYARILRHSRL